MATSTPRPPANRGRQILASKRALVVDGDRGEQRHLQRVLSGWGIAVEATADPLHGLALLWGALEEGQPFDLTLFGPQCHGVLGEQFAALVRSEPRLAEMPILHIGDRADVGHKAAPGRQGFFDTIAVPIDKTLLFDALHRACGAAATAAGVVRLMDRHTGVRSSTPRLNILVVEPDPEQRRLVRFELARGGHQVFEVLSGEQAIEALAKYRFDLVILSLDLPGLGAAGTLKLFAHSMARGDWPAFIGLAQDPTATQVRDYGSCGMAAIVPRPVQSRALLGAIADTTRSNGDRVAAVELASLAGRSTEVAYLDERVLREVDALGPDANFLSDLIQDFLANVGRLLDGVLQARGTVQCHLRLREFGYALQDNAGSLGALQLYQLGLIASQYPKEIFEHEGEQLVSRMVAAYRGTRRAFWQYLQQRALSRAPG
jgi:two-component system, sensor histidine kinase RpfC